MYIYIYMYIYIHMYYVCIYICKESFGEPLNEYIVDIYGVIRRHEQMCNIVHQVEPSKIPILIPKLDRRGVLKMS